MSVFEADLDPEAEIIFEVVINDEEQYSIWAVDSPVPAGWRSVGMRGSKDDCLCYVERVWTDMRPRSLRERISRPR